jgi:S-adenosylmethionine:tRNA ribosyltransferase-isomerase
VETADFDFDLPPEMIARVPATRRSDARLLVLDRATGTTEHRHARDLSDLLRSGDLLVVNDSRVRPARILGHRRTGGRVEILLVDPDMDGAWTAMAKPGRRLKAGEVILLPDECRARLESRDEEGYWHVRFPDDLDLDAYLDQHGRMPLPPYIAREADDDSLADLDRERYQTVYARELGSCAAPTAGLHLDGPLLAGLRARGVQKARVTLHVGPGTFKPVKAEQIEAHRLHSERYEITAETVDAINATRKRGGRVVAVGTTSVRVLESLARTGGLRETSGATELFITPGFEFQIVDALLTNFHLPRSSLLMLVSAFATRDRILAAYEEAVESGYRFYSYGDAMLIL